MEVERKATGPISDFSRIFLRQDNIYISAAVLHTSLRDSASQAIRPASYFSYRQVD